MTNRSNAIVIYESFLAQSNEPKNGPFWLDAKKDLVSNDAFCRQLVRTG